MVTQVYRPVGADIEAVHSSPQFKLGTRGRGQDNQQYVYVQASGAIDQYDCVLIDEDFQAVSSLHANAGASHLAGWPQVAMADNEYGWAVLSGSNFLGNVADNTTADAQLYFSSTAGTLNSLATQGAGTAYVALDGVVVVAAASGGGASELLATYPVVVE